MQYEIFYTEGTPRMRAMKKGNDPKKLINHVMQTDAHEWELFRAGNGFHSTTQDEFLVNWYSRDGHSYYANRAKNEPELLRKQYKPQSPQMGEQRLVEIAKSFIYLGNKKPKLREFQDRDTDIVSDIDTTWVDEIEIAQDIREYLMKLVEDGEEDFVIEDRIDAIERGIKEFRKITRL